MHLLMLMMTFCRFCVGFDMSDNVSPLHCVGGAVGGHSPLPFCTPVLYSRLTPPSGSWVKIFLKFLEKNNQFFQMPTIYVDPIITGNVQLDMISQLLTVNMKLSVYWQDFRLIIRLISLNFIKYKK